MSFFSGEPFFLLFTVVMIGALIIGLLEKNLKWYNIFVSAMFIVFVLGGTISALAYFIAFLAVELLLVKVYEKIRNKKLSRDHWKVFFAER